MNSETVSTMPVKSATVTATETVAADKPYRLVPHNTEAEQALLGALLLNNRAYEKVNDFLRPEHFYTPVHGRLYEAIGKLIERGQLATPVTLKNYFERDGELSAVGGARYLAELAVATVSVVSAGDFGVAIHETHLRRQLIELGETMVADANRMVVDTNSSDLIEDAERQLFDLATIGDFRGGFITFRDSLAKAIETAESAFRRDTEITGVTSGLKTLDRKMGGLHRSDLIILAGRPSMGKTALATNIAFSAAEAYLKSNGKEGAAVGFFSLEMSAEQLATRILADVSQISSDKIRRGDLKADDFQTFVEASQRLAQLPFYIDDTASLSIGALRTRARRLQRQKGLGMVVVDYLQLLTAGGRRGPENRVVEISEITRGLKALAKELDLPVLALSQLSRQVEQREDKKPQLSDLRESGSIEQDADVVMFVYRPEYYIEREEPARLKEISDEKYNEQYTRWQERLEASKNIAEVILGKQRHGPIGTIKLFFEGSLTRFDDLEERNYPDAM